MIEDFIPKGYNNRVSREYLHSILHIPDRDIRAQIEEALSRGILIVSYDGGYFRRKNQKDDPYIQSYLDAEEHRAKTQLHNNKMRRLVWEGIHPEKRKGYIKGQMSLFKR